MLRIAEQFSLSDVGRQRQGNEDAYYVRSPLFVVADGMGGAQAGEVASDMAVRSFDGELSGRSPADALVRAVKDANRRIHERSQTERGRAGMGTTLTAAYLTSEDELIVAHVGDSRCYLLRDGRLTRLTRDHSLVGELVARGKLTEQEAESHPQRSVITRALGPEPDVEVDVEAFGARAGDVFLLCSDGLTGMVGEDGVRDVLTGNASLEQSGRELVAAANRAGGRDNITVVLFRLAELDEPRAAASGADAEAESAGTATRHATATQTLEPVQAPAATPAPAEASRPAPGRRRGRSAFKALVVIALLLFPVVAGGWVASRLVYFIGIDPERNQAVTIYRGLPYELPGGLDLYERFYTSGVTLSAIPESRREVFTNHQLRSREDVEDLVIELERGELNQ